MKRITLILFSMPFLLSANEDRIKAKATELLKPLKQNLMQTLQSEMKSHGVIGAIKACKMEAPKIANSLQDESRKIELGRTSHRLRNPDNAPKDWVKPYLAEFVSSGKYPSAQVIPLLKNRVGYIEPILLAQPLCLKCHGTEIDSETLTHLKTLYPNDQATGFKAGEFRGFFWVEMDSNQI